MLQKHRKGEKNRSIYLDDAGIKQVCVYTFHAHFARKKKSHPKDAACSAPLYRASYVPRVCVMKNTEGLGALFVVSLPLFWWAAKQSIFLQFQRGILSVSAIKVCCFLCGRDLYYMDHGFFNTSYKKI